MTQFVRTAAAAALISVSALASVRAQTGANAGSTTSLDARVKRIEDVEEIQRLLLDYGRTLDARDFAAYSRLFAKDGVWSGGFGTVQGPSAIQAFMEKAMPGANTAHNYHLMSNFVIEVTGDTATAWSRWQFVAPGADGKPAIAQAGRYDDTLVREDGHWRFKRRTASNDLPASRPGQARESR